MFSSHALFSSFHLPEAKWIKKPLAVVVHAATKWDVLRAKHKQGSDEPLSSELLKGLSKARLTAVYQQMHPNNRRSNLTVPELKRALCPEEQEKKPSTKKSHAIDEKQLELDEASLIAKPTHTHKFYDVFTDNYNLIDVMDRTYYMYFHVSGSQQPNAHGLKCAAAYLTMTARAIFEEYRLQHLSARTEGNNAAVLEQELDSVPQFIVDVAEQFKTKYPLSKHNLTVTVTPQ